MAGTDVIFGAEASFFHKGESRVGILKQNAKSSYFGILGFEVRRNSKNFILPKYFVKTLVYAKIVHVIYTAWVA
jgi:hypothetical protein